MLLGHHASAYLQKKAKQDAYNIANVAAAAALTGAHAYMAFKKDKKKEEKKADAKPAAKK